MFLRKKADGRYVAVKTRDSRKCLPSEDFCVGSEVSHGVSAIVFRGLALCICHSVPRSGVVCLPWCSAVWRCVSAVVFRGLALCICLGVPQSSVVYLPWCSGVWRGAVWYVVAAWIKQNHVL